ncbi:hypothetical protein MHU86_577 [Fragilaria crotonensis]|nr:hypothetical protein MHU86_577 [Fragilaria crotonensis]
MLDFIVYSLPVSLHPHSLLVIVSGFITFKVIFRTGDFRVHSIKDVFKVSEERKGASIVVDVAFKKKGKPTWHCHSYQMNGLDHEMSSQFVIFIEDATSERMADVMVARNFRKLPLVECTVVEAPVQHKIPHHP